VRTLRSPSNALHTSPQACAQLTANFWAGVSSKPQVCPMAQQEVLATLQAAPQLTSPLHPDGIDHPFFDFAAAGISTPGQLLHLQQALAAVASQAAYTLVRFAHLGGSYAFAERHVAVERTGALLAALLAGWVAAARAAALALAAGQLAPPLPADALQSMLPQLGWRWLGQPLQLADCSVRQGTCLQQGPMWQRRCQQYLEPTQPRRWMGQWGQQTSCWGCSARRLWRVRWDNQHKEQRARPEEQLGRVGKAQGKGHARQGAVNSWKATLNIGLKQVANRLGEPSLLC
jgi:hypothetical protein